MCFFSNFPDFGSIFSVFRKKTNEPVRSHFFSFCLFLIPGPRTLSLPNPICRTDHNTVGRVVCPVHRNTASRSHHVAMTVNSMDGWPTRKMMVWLKCLLLKIGCWHTFKVLINQPIRNLSWNTGHCLYKSILPWGRHKTEKLTVSRRL